MTDSEGGWIHCRGLFCLFSLCAFGAGSFNRALDCEVKKWARKRIRRLLVVFSFLCLRLHAAYF